MAKTIVEYTTSENMLIVSTGIEPVGQVRVHIVDDMQQNFYDEEDNLIRSEISALHRLPKMEANRVIAEFYAEPEERAEAKKAAEKLATEKAVTAEKERKAAAKAEKKRLDEEAAENQVEIPTAKRTHKIIDAFAGEHGIADTEEYQNAETKAEKVAAIEAFDIE